MSSGVFTVTDSVRDRAGRPRWVVTATFVGADGHEPRCVDYRVRVVPTPAEGESWMHSYGRLLVAMEEQAMGDDEAAAIGGIPPEGIPRYVFERASQARLLGKVRSKIDRRPDAVSAEVTKLLALERKPRRGRPPSRKLREKLEILADIEAAFESGGTLADVADRRHLSRSTVRDVLAWGRSGDSGAQLFEGTTPGRRGGRMTDAGREALASLVDGTEDG